MICIAWLSLPVIYSILYVFFSRMGMPWCPVPSLFIFLWLIIPIESKFGCPIPDISWVILSKLLLIVYAVEVGNPVSDVLRIEVALTWCGSPIILRFWRAPPILDNQLWWWWCCWWIYSVNIPLLKCQMLVCLTVIVGMYLFVIPPPWLSVHGVIGFLLHHDFSLRISLPRSIAAFLTLMYHTRPGIFLNDWRRHRRDSLSMV